MTQSYAALISRFEFDDLFKYGHIHILNAVPTHGESIGNAADRNLFLSLTQCINTCDTSSDYVILQFYASNAFSASKEIYITQVAAVYALDAEAKARLTASFDPRIHLEVSPWGDDFAKLRAKNAAHQAKIGIYNCFTLFDIPQEDRDALARIISPTFIEDVFADFYAKKRPNGEKPVWEYLIRYERHSPYWNFIKGFFSDAIHAFENYRNRREIDDDIADQVELGQVVNACDNTDSFDTIYARIRQANCKAYEVDHCHYLAVAPLYLYMKSLFKDNGISSYANLAERNIVPAQLYQTYAFDFSFAIFLLGMTLGQDQTYGAFYEKIHLPIFSPPCALRETAVPQHPQTERVENAQEATDLQSTQAPNHANSSSFPVPGTQQPGPLGGTPAYANQNQATQEAYQLLQQRMKQRLEKGQWPENCSAIIMAKQNKNGSFRKNSKPIEVRNMDDFSTKKKEGYGIMKCVPCNALQL